MEVTRPFRMPRALPALALALALGWIYFITLAPGLTWANIGNDGGDLITAAATGGVAHPSGYPLYLLLARLFQAVPFGGLAWRTNLMSAVFAVGAALLVQSIIRRETKHWLAGLTAGLAAGLAPMLWSQAVITEVHALQAFLVALVIYLSTGPNPDPWKKRLDCLRGLALGLASGNHLTILLLLPAVVLVNSVRVAEPGGRNRLDWPALARHLFFFLAGGLIYLLLPVWAAAQPPVNWGNVVTPERLAWLVSGSLYQDLLFSVSPAAVLDRLGAWAALLLQQYGLVGLLLGAAGLFFFDRRSRLFKVSAWTLVIFPVFSIGYSTFDSYGYLLSSFLAFALWMGVGAGSMLDAINHDSPKLASVAGIGMLAFFAWLGWTHLPLVDASQDRRAEQFAARVMNEAPAQAIIFTEGDRAIFSLWYAHYALRQRPDLTVIASGLLGFDWYRETLKATYPGLTLPDLLLPETVEAANPALAVCHVFHFGEELIQCRGASGE